MVGPPAFLASGMPASPLNLVQQCRAGWRRRRIPFPMSSILRSAPGMRSLPTSRTTRFRQRSLEDGDITVGLGNPENGPAESGSYDNELLDAHFVAGDGRANENIGLTAAHHVFHSEHNRLVEHTKVTVLQTKDLTLINEWLQVALTQAQVDALPTTLPTNPAALATFLDGFTGDGERLFQAAESAPRCSTSIWCSSEFARKVSADHPRIPGSRRYRCHDRPVDHLRVCACRLSVRPLDADETIDRFDEDFNADHIGLIEGFLNPLQFQNNGTTATVDANIAAGDIIRGMTRQAGNEIDEFVTSALRNNLLGLPLDLGHDQLGAGPRYGRADAQRSSAPVLRSDQPVLTAQAL